MDVAPFLALTRPLVIGLVLVCLGTGCDQTPVGPNHLSLPAPIRADLPFTYRAKMNRFWTADAIETFDGDQLHFVVVEGVAAVPRHSNVGREARQWLQGCCDRGELDVEVIAYDDFKRELGHVGALDEHGARVNVGLELLRRGYAWFDRSEGDYADEYRAAEATAREQAVGLWVDPSPIPPWEIWEQQQEELRAMVR